MNDHTNSDGPDEAIDAFLKKIGLTRQELADMVFESILSSDDIEKIRRLTRIQRGLAIRCIARLERENAMLCRTLETARKRLRELQGSTEEDEDTPRKT